MHGTSHQYVSERAAQHLNITYPQMNAITIHLGNGCSMAAIQKGQCIDTSMGLSPLPGLIMGTRSGDIDPAIIFYLANNLNMSVGDIDQLLNKESGLKGISGDNDMRNLTKRYEEGDKQAVLALEMYAYRIKKYIGAYLAALGKADALIFTAGVGENSPLVRKLACQGLGHLGIRLDEDRNKAAGNGIQELQQGDSPVKVLVVPTNEELSIAEQAYALFR